MGGALSKYDDLDARAELEQAIARDLNAALQKRGFSITHNGSDVGHAPAGQPDIVVHGRDEVAILFEATKSRGAAQDRELNAVRAHLEDYKRDHPTQRCFAVFTSPATGRRMIDGIGDHNRQRAAEGKPDLRIMPMSFDVLELWAAELSGSPADFYPMSALVALMQRHEQFLDDLRVRKLVVETLFPQEDALREEVRRLEVERDQETLESLVKDLARLESHMRESGVATGPAAIDVLIQLVFLKVHEEKRAARGQTNRFRNSVAFEKYLSDSVDARTRAEGRGVHRLFSDISQDPEFVGCGMFARGETLPDSITDNFITARVMPIFEKYVFEGTRVDALGAVYEVLAMRSSKDVKVGQFFTPENVVRFMVDISGADYRDRVLDPACGTGRFLIHAMDVMLTLVEGSQERDKQSKAKSVCEDLLWGSDIDPRIARIAKMNMWIHGDGKTNILGGFEANGLTLYRHPLTGSPTTTFDDAFDLVLTNPPLGDLNYTHIPFGGEGQTLEAQDPAVVGEAVARFPLLPHTDERVERIAKLEARLAEHNGQLALLESDLEAAPGDRRLSGVVQRKRETVRRNQEQLDAANAELLAGAPQTRITGSIMKGGALFLAAISSYLKPLSRPDELAEWRGGRLVAVLDDSILNTDTYGPTRAYIREHYYIKAVISLSRDTFVPVSNTTTKTSILYAIKKTNPSDTQREPVFFAHAAKVGMDTKGRVCINDLAEIALAYDDFAARVRQAYVSGQFDLGSFDASERGS